MCKEAEDSHAVSMRRFSQNQTSTLPSGCREEHKRIVYVSHPTMPDKKIKYRLCYTKSSSQDLENNEILRIEISHDLENLVHYIRKILDYHKFRKLRIYVRYSEFLKLHEEIEKVSNDLFTCNYNFKFSFIPSSYRDDEYVLLYEIEGIRRGEHYG
ncbi:hypothetical protein [Encephalitozoon cuniculi GB-M1]|uniref:PX domain-containing protein n=2 Tax=Encephalitozoon cuniculi TaxID=6035 RepID=Q8SVC9_ENCCU|nr:uncharacterized protein ECU06_0550 [Encephalitozoon cuniculi GB-M1]AGE95757.1 hypothetical protein ECU06_0550 [Encephalitozoon cuniculi]KMV65951.1 hypothetical protein M970_060500 [Encephalitozoon cuniculi EcunIII-L]UYI27644.1 putative ribonuclease E [Encephalitozoon cuniculi]CAD25415.1 hypothetical protein [Encephalitozoon cuniculi GB-M1]